MEYNWRSNYDKWKWGYFWYTKSQLLKKPYWIFIISQELSSYGWPDIKIKITDFFSFGLKAPTTFGKSVIAISIKSGTNMSNRIQVIQIKYGLKERMNDQEIHLWKDISQKKWYVKFSKHKIEINLNVIRSTEIK